MANGTRPFTAPIFLGTAFLVFGIALLEKFLNLFGWGLPIGQVYPRQILDWAVALAVFEIALSLRQLVDIRVRERESAAALPDAGGHPH